jgi:hypothetical protein
MATYSKKMMGKEVGSASVYAKPHSNPVMAGRPVPSGEKTKTTRVNGSQPSTTQPQPNKRSNMSKLDNLDVSVGAESKSAGDESIKTSGIKIRGTGAATKGVMARGPMA